MAAEILVLRLVHILGGIFWVGSGLFTTFFLVPSLAAAGPAAGQIMGALQRRRLFTVLPAVALLTILSGVRLMQLTSGNFSPAYFHSDAGRGFAWGGTFAIAGFVLSLLVVRPAAVKSGALAAQLAQAADDATRGALSAQLATLRRRGAVWGIVATSLLLLAAGLMAVARYL
jgi:uncharacterized membrane protein